ncbi:MAG: hypothetical protein JXL97_12080 [Bacteroidales bacterium]|nr:hypothetical protein [Bacteroidales bacterium]
MKKIFLYIPFILVLLFASCKKEDAAKDVENALNKLAYFNEKFEELYVDGVISTEAPNEDEKSEFDQLKKIASEYYEIMNKINSNIEEEKEDLEKGKSIDDYEKNYNELLKEKQAVINELTMKFEENLSKM